MGKVFEILQAKCISDGEIGTMFKSFTKGTKPSPCLPHGLPSFYDYRTVDGMVFADKTMYIEKLEMNGGYRCLFLRPRKFGKSTFLNTLCLYYDIRTAPVFKELFGPLYIGQHPTRSCCSHLILKFDLSSISTIGSLEELQEDFNHYINGVLRRFIQKYAEELGNPSLTSLSTSATHSLRNVLVSFLILYGTVV